MANTEAEQQAPEETQFDPEDLLLDAQDCLAALDLRTLPKPARQPIKDARTGIKVALKEIGV